VRATTDNLPPAAVAADAPSRARLAHQPALDGLRGAAVAAVLLYHGGHLTGGFLGVDAFFVLSGFLITSLLLTEVSSHGRIALRAFWSRRARRLLPALACVLGAVAFYAWFLARPDELATIRGDALATIGYVANWRAIFTSRDYWAIFRAPSPLDHTWSLAIEEQFYLVWPLLVALLVHDRPPAEAARNVLVTAALLACGSLAWTQVIFDPADPSRVYYGTDTRIASILVGAALAAWLSLSRRPRGVGARRTLECAAVVALALLAVAWTRFSGSSATLYRGGLFACALATAVVIAAAVHPSRGPVHRVLSFRPLCALGIISYGVYLWHWPIYVALDPARVHLTGWPLLGVRAAATLAVAVVSFRFVERPIRHGVAATPAAKRRILALTPLVAAIIVVAIIASTAGAPIERIVVADAVRPPLPVRSVRTVRGQLVIRPQRVMVVGNSIALYAGDDGFKQLHTVPPLDVLNLGSIGCRLLPEETRTRYPSGDIYDSQAQTCRTNWASAVSLFRPDVVVFLVGDPTDDSHEVNGVWTAPCAPTYDNVLAREMHEQVGLLASRGARVVVATAAYAGFPSKSAAWFRHADCQNAIFRQVVASEPRAVLADIFSWMCPRIDSDCDRTIGGIVLRPDGVHFRGPSARLLAAWLIAQGQRRGAFAGVRVDGIDRRAAELSPTP